MAQAMGKFDERGVQPERAEETTANATIVGGLLFADLAPDSISSRCCRTMVREPFIGSCDASNHRDRLSSQTWPWS